MKASILERSQVVSMALTAVGDVDRVAPGVEERSIVFQRVHLVQLEEISV